MVSDLPDQINWASATPYAYLVDMPRSAFAWEWLRRSVRYRQSWVSRMDRTEPGSHQSPEHFGLMDFEDPALGAGHARPLWSYTIDPTVLMADVVDRDPGPDDAFNLLALATLSKLHVGATKWEHVLLSDGREGIRLDIVSGSVVGSPSLLAYRIEGQASALAPVETLRKLVELVRHKSFPAPSQRERRSERWILELRAADALASGATAQEIARSFYPALTAEHRWRTVSAPVRRRVQRLMARARGQSVEADIRCWFPKIQGGDKA